MKKNVALFLMLLNALALVVGSVGCGGGAAEGDTLASAPDDMLSLVPPDSPIVVHFNVEEFVGSSYWQSIRRSVEEATPEDSQAAFRRAIEEVIVDGVAGISPDDRVAVVVMRTKVGFEEVRSRLIQAEVMLREERRGSETVYRLDEDAALVRVAERMIGVVIAPDTRFDAVMSHLRHPEGSVRNQPYLQELAGPTWFDASTLAFAAEIPTEQMNGHFPFKRIGCGFRLENGLRALCQGSALEAAQASAFVDEASAQLEGVISNPAVRLMGLGEILQAIRIERAERTVTASASLTDEQVSMLIDRLQMMIRAGLQEAVEELEDNVERAPETGGLGIRHEGEQGAPQEEQTR